MNAIPSAMPGSAEELVILRCPKCHSAEPIAAEAIAEGVQVVICRQCGEGWAAKAEERPVRRSDCEDEQGRSLVWADARTIDAVRRPLVAFNDDEPDPWALRIESDHEPVEVRRSPVYSWLVFLVSGLFLAGFFGAREQIVTAVPDLAGLYAAVGLPVNMSGLEIAGVKAAAEPTGFETRFRVTGAVRNISQAELAVPPLKVEFLDRYGRLLHTIELASPAQSLAAGRQAAFSHVLKDYPWQSVRVRVTFKPPERGRPVSVAARGGG
jgi:hypothetical protein